MQSYKLITFIADDRPGVVRSLSEAVVRHGGNWLESRMAKLAGRFAGIVRVAVPQGREAEFDRAVAALEAVGLTTLRIEAAPAVSAPAAVVAYRLEIIGHDRPGIVHEFASALARRQINVFDMRSDIRSAPMSADPLFSASAAIHVPAELDIEELRDHLEALADELTIEYTLEPL